MAYQSLSLIQTIATGQPFLAATLQQADDNDAFFADPPACSIKESTPQSVNDNTLAVLTSNEENFDNDSMHSTVSNTSRITCQTAGRYLCTATIDFAADVNGHRQFEFLVNGTTSYPMTRVPAVDTGASTIISGSQPIILAAGDYVEVRILHLAGNALDVTLSQFSLHLMTL